MLFNFPLSALTAFLKVDFSDVPALIAAITMGPIAGILVALFKNILYMIFSGSPTGVPVGEMANFATSVLFMLPVYMVYRKISTTKGLTIGLIAGVFTMAIGMSVLNYAVFLPMYTYFLNAPAMTGTVLTQTILLGILPFNLIKGLLLSAVIILLFKTMKTWLDKQRAIFS